MRDGTRQEAQGEDAKVRKIAHVIDTQIAMHQRRQIVIRRARLRQPDDIEWRYHSGAQLVIVIVM